ncbi:MAG: hypothetical protein QOJ65_560, partial [Fimbriimonadaceae bacterium]|nr:hypothetical protein [Fimbriimonadaceae bacterium]
MNPRPILWTVALICLLAGTLLGCDEPRSPVTATPEIQAEPAATSQITPQEPPAKNDPAPDYSQADMTSARTRVKRLLKAGRSMYLLHGEATDAPA